MNKTFKLLFYLKKPKNYATGSMPIYLRITIDGERIELHTKRNCEPSKWNNISGRTIGLKEESKQLNNYLDLLQAEIFEAQRELLSGGQKVTVFTIKNKLLGKEELQKTLLDVYRYHNKQFAALVGKEYAIGTLKKYNTAIATLEAFIKWQYRKFDISLKELNNQFITEYEFFLKSVKNMQHNTAMGIIKKLKKIVHQCVANEWLDKDPFMNYKVKIHDNERGYLSDEELKTIMNKVFFVERLTQVRDLFVFSCFTGLSYSDVAKLTSNDISNGIDGEKWIFTTRTKTGESSRIPLLPAALDIIGKYKCHPKINNSEKLLPMLSNQRMNSYLKEIADLCEIRKELTFHIARHTFATTVTLSNGVPIESVSKMLGHRNLRTTQHYAKILDRKVSDDMKLLREKFTMQIKNEEKSFHNEHFFLDSIIN